MRFFRVEASGTLQPIRAPFRPEPGYFHTDGWRGKRQQLRDAGGRDSKTLDQALYLQNYGGPMGYKLAVAHPE